MTRLFNSLLLSVALASCVTSYRHGHLEPVPYSGHGPIFHVPARSPYQVSPRMIDAGPEVAPIISTLLQHAAVSLNTLTAPEQPDLAPLIYQGQERYQLAIIEPVGHRMFAPRIVKHRHLFSHIYTP